MKAQIKDPYEQFTKLDGIKEKESKQRMSAELRELHSEVVDKCQAIAKYEKKISSLTSDNSTLQMTVRNQEAQIRKISAKLMDLHSEVVEKRQAVVTYQERINSLTSDNSTLQMTVRNQEVQIRKVSAELEFGVEEIGKLYLQLKSKKEMSIMDQELQHQDIAESSSTKAVLPTTVQHPGQKQTYGKPLPQHTYESIPGQPDAPTLQQHQHTSHYRWQTFLQEQEKQRPLVEQRKNICTLEDADFNPNTEPFECPICFCPYKPGEGVTLRGCLHQFCKECLEGHIKLCNDAEVTCPFMDDENQCQVPITQREIRGLVSEEVFDEVCRRGLRQAEYAAANSFHCRTPNCGGFCFYEDGVNKFDCPICAKRNCLTCKAIHEGMNCYEYHLDLKRKAENDAAEMATQHMFNQMFHRGEAMFCPSCKIIVQKKDGSDWIKCCVCKTEICWATKGPRWGPNGRNDTSGGCRCRIGGKKCHPLCRNCH